MNLYIVPHSHTDPGWIETMEYYYTREVRDILSNVIAHLKVDPGKRFAWGEVCFLKKFYDEASDDVKLIIREMVESG